MIPESACCSKEFDLPLSRFPLRGSFQGNSLFPEALSQCVRIEVQAFCPSQRFQMRAPELGYRSRRLWRSGQGLCRACRSGASCRGRTRRLLCSLSAKLPEDLAHESDVIANGSPAWPYSGHRDALRSNNRQVQAYSRH